MRLTLELGIDDIALKFAAGMGGITLNTVLGTGEGLSINEEGGRAITIQRSGCLIFEIGRHTMSKPGPLISRTEVFTFRLIDLLMAWAPDHLALGRRIRRSVGESDSEYEKRLLKARLRHMWHVILTGTDIYRDDQDAHSDIPRLMTMDFTSIVCVVLKHENKFGRNPQHRQLTIVHVTSPDPQVADSVTSTKDSAIAAETKTNVPGSTNGVKEASSSSSSQELATFFGLDPVTCTFPPLLRLLARTKDCEYTSYATE